MNTVAPKSDLNLIIKRNCSISPVALSCLLGAMVFASLGMAGVFAWLGAWLILPFAGIEMAGLATAFYLTARHAGDYERIGLRCGRLCVEVCEAQEMTRHEFDASWVRVAGGFHGMDYRLILCAKGKELEIGRHYDLERRLGLAATLGKHLHRY